jgi:hypothetical protein
VSNRLEVLAQKGISLQPYLVFIGSVHNIKKYKLVFTKDIIYDFDAPLPALDALFKSFFALDSLYPVESRHIWTFLQQVVYKIETPQDYQGDAALKSFLSGDKKEFLSLKI